VRESPSGRKRAPGLSLEERRNWARTYERTKYTELPWFSARPSPFVAQAVALRWIRRGARLLDIGCGAGTNVLWLARHGFRVSGLDVAPGAVEAANARARRQHVRAAFRVGDATALPFSRAAFDGALDIGCFHTLPIPLRTRYAEEVARVVRPEGSFLLSWIGREETREYGPPHRPSLAEVTAVFESRFVFSSVEFHGPGSRRGWVTPGGALALYSAHLRRRRGAQPPPR
jgi:SAM-dependent methyltransferase